tara:strand:- start:236 stop:427 length:192 start_codon:yes stop_codon:yes gene_type:complete
MDIYWEIDKRMREVASRHLSMEWLTYEEYEDLLSFLVSAGRKDIVKRISALYPDHKFRWDNMT